MVKILDGKKASEKALDNLKKRIEANKLKLGLAIISVGQSKVSEIYLRQKRLACERTGVGFRLHRFPKRISQKKLKTEIKKIGGDKMNSGIVIQLPLPFSYLVTSEFFDLIPAKKDTDCLGTTNFNSFCRGDKKVMPPVVLAIKKLFKNYKIEIKDKNIVVVGTGRLVGLPVSLWLANEKAKVITVNRSTRNIIDFIKKADIIISGAGKANLINGSMVKKGVILVDVGASIERGKVLGDIEVKSVFKKASFLAPVPGGVGPLTIACLLENLVNLNSR